MEGFRTSRTQTANSFETLSDETDDYLDTCPIYHDVDSQSIYGFEIIQHRLRKSEEILWKDRKCSLSLVQKIFFTNCSLINSVEYKFQIPPKPTQIATAINGIPSQNIERQRSGSADYSAMHHPEIASTFKKKRWFESDSITSIHLESSLKLFHEDERAMTRNLSRHKILENEKGFLSRKASMVKMNLSQRRNTVG